MRKCQVPSACLKPEPGTQMASRLEQLEVRAHLQRSPRGSVCDVPSGGADGEGVHGAFDFWWTMPGMAFRAWSLPLRPPAESLVDGVALLLEALV